MGVYTFIFGCIGIGILLWVISGVLGEYFTLSAITVEQIASAGSILFVIGLISLASIFLINFFTSGRQRIRL